MINNVDFSAATERQLLEIKEAAKTTLVRVTGVQMSPITIDLCQGFVIVVATILTAATAGYTAVGKIGQVAVEVYIAEFGCGGTEAIHEGVVMKVT